MLGRAALDWLQLVLGKVLDYWDWAGAVVAVLYLVYSVRKVDKGIDRFFSYLRRWSQRLLDISQIVKSRVVVSAEGSPWWEDGPIYGLFLWLGWFGPNLAERFSRDYIAFQEWASTQGYQWIPPADYIVDTPFAFSGFMVFVLFMIWSRTAFIVLEILVNGLRRPAGTRYWEWCHREMRKRNIQKEHENNIPGPRLYAQSEKEEEKENEPPKDSNQVPAPSFGERLVFRSLFFGFFMLIWPALAFHLLIGAFLWIVAAGFAVLATFFALLARFGNWSKAGALITIVVFILDRILRN